MQGLNALRPFKIVSCFEKYIAPLVNVLNTLLIVQPLLYIMNANKMRIAVFQFEIGSKNRL